MVLAKVIICLFDSHNYQALGQGSITYTISTSHPEDVPFAFTHRKHHQVHWDCRYVEHITSVSTVHK